MTTEEKLNLLMETIEAEPGDLTPETVLDKLDYWDSLAKLSIIAMFTTKFDRLIDISTLRNFNTVGDILQEMHN